VLNFRQTKAPILAGLRLLKLVDSSVQPITGAFLVGHYRVSLPSAIIAIIATTYGLRQVA